MQTNRFALITLVIVIVAAALTVTPALAASVSVPVANAGFEEALDEQTNWRNVPNDPTYFRYQMPIAPEGDYVLLFVANNGQAQAVNQEFSVPGEAGDVIVLSYRMGWLNLEGGVLGARMDLLMGDERIRSPETCGNVRSITVPEGSSGFESFTCEMIATGTYNTIEILVGWANVLSGFQAVDDIRLTVVRP